MEIRTETPDDVASIRHLTDIAFAAMEFSDGSEPRIIDELRRAGDLLLSLVAVEAGVLVGHVTFSPVTFSPAIQGTSNWVGLGPISVQPDRQRQGIGTALVEAGAAQLATTGHDGIVLIGNPAVYAPMGFIGDGRIAYRGLPSDIVQWRSIRGARPAGEIVYAPAFG